MWRGKGEWTGEPFSQTRRERAIGVVYRPETERGSHYFETRLPAQVDAIIHWDETRALEPLDRSPGLDAGEAPDTCPSGL